MYIHIYIYIDLRLLGDFMKSKTKKGLASGYFSHSDGLVLSQKKPMFLKG